jgi:hypothetical protein
MLSLQKEGMITVPKTTAQAHFYFGSADKFPFFEIRSSFPRKYDLSTILPR